MAPLKVLTWNIRLDALPDSITIEESLKSIPGPFDKPEFSNNTREKPWSTRRIKVAQLILQSGVVVAGFQEALVRQVNDLIQLLGPNRWDYVGVGRSDGVKKGEFSPIFYDKTVIKVLSWDTFWLSNTPFVPSIFPGAGTYRICTAAHLAYTPLGSTDEPIKFTVLNTHFDHQSDDQRKLGASLMLARAKFEAAKTGEVVVIMGDLNSSSAGTDSGAYRIITGATPPVAIPTDFIKRFPTNPDTVPNFHTLDTRGTTHALHRAGCFATWTNFTKNGSIASDTDRIDFVFGDSASAERLWSSTDYFVPNVLSDDGILASDHRPVIVSLDVKDWNQCL